MATTARVCKATTKAGRACAAPALAGFERCWWHEPSMAVQRAEARSRGGRGRHKRILDGDDSTPEPVTDIAGLLVLLNRQVRDAYGLEPSLSRVRAIVQVAGVMQRALQLGELERRMARIEEQLGYGK